MILQFNVRIQINWKQKNLYFLSLWVIVVILWALGMDLNDSHSVHSVNWIIFLNLN